MPVQSRAKKAAYRYAVRLTRRSGSSFYLAFLSLPSPMYRAMCVIYAFMRLTDDIADAPLKTSKSKLTTEQTSQFRMENLQKWKQDFQDAIAGKKTSHPLLPALIDVIKQFQIAPQWLEDVIEGVEFDLQPISFPIYADLEKYCYHVAGTVGLCCQAVWGSDLVQTKSLALICGQAFQLTNILRDLHEDARNGRCYLPTEDLTRFRCTVQDISSQQNSVEFNKLMRFQIERAFCCYQEAASLEAHLKGPGLKMFRKMYTTYYLLLCEIAKSPEQVLRKRIKLSKLQKAEILLLSGNRPLSKLLKKD